MLISRFSILGPINVLHFLTGSKDVSGVVNCIFHEKGNGRDKYEFQDICLTFWKVYFIWKLTGWKALKIRQLSKLSKKKKKWRKQLAYCTFALPRNKYTMYVHYENAFSTVALYSSAKQTVCSDRIPLETVNSHNRGIKYAGSLKINVTVSHFTLALPGVSCKRYIFNKEWIEREQNL